MTADRTGRRLMVAGVAGLAAVGVLRGPCSDARHPGRPSPAGSERPGEARAIAATTSSIPSDATGPRRVEAGVPVGYARSNEGAAAAATQYLGTLAGLMSSTVPDREAALRRMASSSEPAVVERGIDGLAAIDSVVAVARRERPDARVLLTEVPLAHNALPSGDGRVEVDIWSVAVALVEGRTDAMEVWSTNQVGLVWEGGDWRVAWWRRSPGPTPTAARNAATPTDQVLTAVGEWSGYRHVPID